MTSLPTDRPPAWLSRATRALRNGAPQGDGGSGRVWLELASIIAVSFALSSLLSVGLVWWMRA